MFNSVKLVLFALGVLLIAAGCGPGLSSIAATTDQSELVNIASKSDDWGVRKAAIEKLTDQAVLSKIALDDETPEVRAAAIDRMTGQAYLAYVALQAGNEGDRKAADQKITDQVVLSNYIQQLGDKKKIDLILENRLTSQTLIAWLAINAPNANLRDAAARKVTSYDIYEDVAAASPIRWVSSSARPAVVREE